MVFFLLGVLLIVVSIWGFCAEIEIRGISMKLNCKRIDFTYTPGEEIFNFPEESGLPFIFDVEEELTGDPAVMDAVGEMLDEAEKLAEKAKAAIKAALADEDSRYHSVVTFSWSSIGTM